jgi:pyruvate/2-oxoacid:ferredoxin oxidoreductase alpha subunit
MNVGLLRPVTLYPFPTKDFERLAKCAKAFVVVEMSNSQLLDDVRLALNGARPVEFYSRVGGNVPSHEEVFRFVEKQVRKYLAASPKEEQMVHV